MVVRPCALTEELLGAPLEIDQGDVIKVSSCRERVLELSAGTVTCVVHALWHAWKRFWAVHGQHVLALLST